MTETEMMLHERFLASFGVHVPFEDLYAVIVFLFFTGALGLFFRKILRLPDMLGHLLAGIILGPYVLDYVPSPETFVLLGEVGLILLVFEAGMEVDLGMVKSIGTRSAAIAVVGVVVPISIGFTIMQFLGYSVRSSFAAAASFGPTSLAISPAILRAAHMINTPLGQLVAISHVIDDVMVLVIMAQLKVLSADVITPTRILIPIVSAVLFLGVGGFLAIFILPDIFEKYLLSKVPKSMRPGASIFLMFSMLMVLLLATYNSRASYLLGSFLSGLTFCSNHEAHHVYTVQVKRIVQWLMRIFFAATIGFQVVISVFNSRRRVAHGFLFLVAVSGKLLTGLMVPNFTHNTRYTGQHLRDCLLMSFSMASEGEFSFFMASASLDFKLITEETYASIILAVTMSSMFSPILLRLTILYYKKQAEKAIREAERMEMESLQKTPEDMLLDGLKNHSVIFMCIQILSPSGWGILRKIMNVMFDLKLQVLDHRSWSPRGLNTTLVNEVFAQDYVRSEEGAITDECIAQRLEYVQATITRELSSEGEEVKVNVRQWFPGILETAQIQTDENGNVIRDRKLRLTEHIIEEAGQLLERNRERQLQFTKDRTVEEILQEQESTDNKTGRPYQRKKTLSAPGPGKLFQEHREITESLLDEPKKILERVQESERSLQMPSTEISEVTPFAQMSEPKPRRKRYKTLSSPVVGGDLFGGVATAPHAAAEIPSRLGEQQRFGQQLAPHVGTMDLVAELRFHDKVIKILLSPAEADYLARSPIGHSSEPISLSSIAQPFHTGDDGFSHVLQGYIRKKYEPVLPGIPDT